MTIHDQFLTVPNKGKRWQLRNPERWKAYCHKKNMAIILDPVLKEIKNARKREYERRKNRESRVRVIEFMGGKCCRCGFLDHRALQIDHVHGNGTEERRKLKSFSPRRFEKMFFYGFESGKYQLLCANCNWIKRHENKENWGRR